MPVASAQAAPVTNGHDRSVREVSFAPNVLAQYARAILGSGGPRAIRVRETAGGKPASVVFVARQEDAKAVLLDEGRFSLRPYAMQFGAIASTGATLLMREPGPERDIRYKILRAAASPQVWSLAAPETLGQIAKDAVGQALESVRTRPEPSFDIIGGYAFFVPYLVAGRIFGLRGTEQFDLLSRTLILAKGRSLTPETRPFQTQLVWSQLVLGQLFGNFENRQWYITWLARMALSRFRKHITAEMRRPGGCERGSLLAGLLAARTQFAQLRDDEFGEHVISLMLELVGTALLAPGIAASRIVEQFGGEDLAGWLAHYEPHRAERFIDEALRLSSPTTQLMRLATRDATLGDFKILAGEYVCVLLREASLDPRAFAAPETFSLERDPERYLHFGPFAGPHRCFGRMVAHPILSEMVAGLKGLPGLKPLGELKMFAGIPERRIFGFDRQPARGA